MALPFLYAKQFKPPDASGLNLSSQAYSDTALARACKELDLSV